MDFACLLEDGDSTTAIFLCQERSGKATKMWTNPREDRGSPTCAPLGSQPACHLCLGALPSYPLEASGSCPTSP